MSVRRETAELTALCKQLEHFETPAWAAKAILEKERLVGGVLDPCCGTGVLAEAALCAGYEDQLNIDIYHWGYGRQAHQEDFLQMQKVPWSREWSVFMNPPFSKAVEFVEKSLALGAYKILCFQRFAWWESEKRRAFWEAHPPCHVYICGHRADCWRHDIPHDQRGSSSPTAHAWFVWDNPRPKGTQLGHIYKATTPVQGELAHTDKPSGEM